MSENMKAVFLRDGTIQFDERAKPTPGPGQVLVKTKCCGICGSDLHFYKHPEELLGPNPPDIFLGHEYCVEICEFGPDTKQEMQVGQRACSIPFIETENGAREPIGTNTQRYGAYSEYFLLSENLMLPVPDNLADEAVALVEPLAVGIHAVSRSDIADNAIALVYGCGPIGLATISALKNRGIDNIVASDPTAKRRTLAIEMGASIVVDPTNDNVMSHVSALQSASYDGRGEVVLFECVGIHTMIPELIASAPPKSTIVFAGVHTKDTTFNPIMAMVKELDIKFTFYYENAEYEQALALLASGKLKWQPLVTGTVGYDGIQGAFETLLSPNEHIKIMVQPWRAGSLLHRV